MKKVMKLSLLAMCLFLAVGCSKKDTPKETGADSGKPFAGEEIVWASNGAGSWEEGLEPIIKKFEDETGAKVNVEYYAYGDFLEMLQVKLGSGNDEYDVIGIDVPMVASYAYKDWIVPLDEYFSEEDKQKFNETALESGSWNGEFYSPAMNSSSQLLWYNTKLLKEAGIEVPKSDVENRLTWEEVKEMADKAVKKLDPDGVKGISGITFEQVSRPYQMNQLSNSMGGLNLNEKGLATGAIDTKPWIDAVSWYQSLFNEGISLKGITAKEAPDFFYSDKILFYMGGTWVGSKAESNGVGDAVDFAPAPAFKGFEDKVGTPTGSWHFGVPSKAKNKKLAAEFIKYMSIGEGNDEWLKIWNDVPATKKGVEATLTNEESEEYMKIAAYETSNTAIPRALTPGYTEYNTFLENMWEDVKNGSDVKASLTNAAKKIDKEMNKYQK